MNFEETQFILQSMRPDGQDAREPICQDALMHVRASPELEQWLAAEQHFDRAMSAALTTVEPPARLRAQILAGGRASQVRPWWKSGQSWAAAAAAVVLMVGGLSLMLPVADVVDDSAQAFRKAMVTELESMKGLRFMNASATEVRAWLASNGAEVPGEVPAGLTGRQTIGCNVFEWRGQKVTLICFRPEDEVATGAAATHLFVVDAADAPELLAQANGAQFASVEAWSTVTWESGGQVFLMATRNPPGSLEKLMKAAG